MSAANIDFADVPPVLPGSENEEAQGETAGFVAYVWRKC